MKKLVMAALCLMIVATGAFAMDKNVGFGIMYNNTTTNGRVSFSDTYYGPYGYETYSVNADWKLTRNGFGAFGFFGLGRFLELNLGFLYKNPDKMTITSEGYTETISGSEMDLEGTGALQLGVYFKYPIPISDMFVFFPTGGIDVEITTSSETWDGWSWWHDFWIRGGLGLDVFFNDRTFLRTHVIYGGAIPIGGEADLGLKGGHGFLMKVGIGFML
ncbi:MAG: hypothetical protein FWD36_02540 [Treponema sp.]|nr:hypothetical protein [Treponema sp.]